MCETKLIASKAKINIRPIKQCL